MPIVSAITGILGSVVGGIEANKAGKTISDTAFNSAGGVENAANSEVAGTQGTTASGQQGVAGATTAGQGVVSGATAAGQGLVSNAVNTGTANVNAATSTANTGLANVNAGEQQNLSPYLQTGQAANTAYQNDLAKPFAAPTAAEVEATPGYNFQLQAGNQLAQQAAATTGQAPGSGGVLKALTQYGQGVASTYYQNAFNNAQSTYNTNLNAAGMGMGVGLSAAGMSDSAAQNAGNLENANTMGGAFYNSNLGMSGATTNANMGMAGASEYANLGMGGNEFDANLGMQGQGMENQAGQFGATLGSNLYMQGAEGKAAGQMGVANSVNQGLGAVGNAFTAASVPGGSWTGYAPSPYYAPGASSPFNPQANPSQPYGGYGYGYGYPPQ